MASSEAVPVGAHLRICIEFVNVGYSVELRCGLLPGERGGGQDEKRDNKNTRKHKLVQNTRLSRKPAWEGVRDCPSRSDEGSEGWSEALVLRGSPQC